MIKHLEGLFSGTELSEYNCFTLVPEGLSFISQTNKPKVDLKIKNTHILNTILETN